MSEAKHTPGPWSYEDNPYGHDAIHGADGRLIAHVFGDDAQAQADARLIAAAPELLEALKVAREEILWWEKEHSCCRGFSDKELAQIDAAIAKATGEQA